MARYTGPSTRIARKFGEAIFGDDKAFEKRSYPPGQHAYSDFFPLFLAIPCCPVDGEAKS